MTNELQIFNNPEFGEIRTLEEGDKVLFCASDVAKALGYSRPNDAVSAHCRATVKRSTPISGKIQEINFIPESDLYRLVFSSKLPTSDGHISVNKTPKVTGKGQQYFINLFLSKRK